jgi:hypothetical protein
MNHHQRHMPPGAQRALRGLALLVVVLSSQEALATLRLPKFYATSVRVSARGYLSSVGAPELRFQAPSSPRVRPSPKSAVGAAPAKIEEANAASGAAASAGTQSVAPAQSTRVDTVPDEIAPQKTKSGPSQRILPDTARPVAHPEDFLPFFRFPAATGPSGSVDVVVPVPATAPAGPPLPPSSATYNQSP